MPALHQINSWAQLGRCSTKKALVEAPTSEDLFRFLRELSEGKCSAETLAWLQRGAKAVLESQGETSFESALGFKAGRFLHSWRTRLRHAQLRTSLWAAWRYLEKKEGSPWLRAGLLEEEIKRFTVEYWPSWALLTTPPKEASTLQCSLFAACKATDGRVPKTQRHLYAQMVLQEGIDRNSTEE